MYFSFFFFNDTATTEIYTLSLHDALPIWLHLLVHLREEALRQPVQLGFSHLVRAHLHERVVSPLGARRDRDAPQRARVGAPSRGLVGGRHAAAEERPGLRQDGVGAQGGAMEILHGIVPPRYAPSEGALGLGCAL